MKGFNRNSMNLLLLFESDFTDGTHSVARLTGRRREHAMSVWKVAVGDELRAGVLNGNMGTAKVERADESSLEMSVVFNEAPPPSLPLTLVLALPRPKALKRCIEAVTAMGVKRVFIIGSRRVEKSYWSSPELSDEKLRMHMLLGLEQACDTVLPQIVVRKRFKPFVEDDAAEIIAGTRAIVAHPYAASACPSNLQGPVTLAIGPEGGFIPFEIELLKKHGFEDASLGKRILRVEHAVPAIIGRLML
jgi:16S rRNA (uracil1498-N3)-methyltransferase